MTRVLVSNPFALNKRPKALAAWLGAREADVSLLNEMRLLHDDVRHLGHLASGTEGHARSNVVLTRRAPDEKPRVAKLCDEVPGSKFWKDRYYVRVVIDGVAYYATHANAVIQRDGHWLDNEGARRWRRGVTVLLAAMRADLNAGLEVVLGGDLNWREVDEPRQIFTPEWICKQLGLTYVTTQVMWLAWSEGLHLDGWKKLDSPPGADGHPVLVADLTPLKVTAPPKDTPVKPPAPPYAGPPAHHSGTGNKPINRVVIHSTVSPCEPGGARNIAAYFRSPGAGGSAQYVVDPTATIQAAYDSVICWHAPPNAHSIGIEMCDVPGPLPSDDPRPTGLRLLTAKAVAAFKSAGRSWRWARKPQRQMLRRTAKLTARLCLAYDVPLEFLGPRRLRAGRRGITTHANVSAAWGRSTHWDPGYWPRAWFMVLVRRHAKKILAK